MKIPVQGMGYLPMTCLPARPPEIFKTKLAIAIALDCPPELVTRTPSEYTTYFVYRTERNQTGIGQGTTYLLATFHRTIKLLCRLVEKKDSQWYT